MLPVVLEEIDPAGDDPGDEDGDAAAGEPDAVDVALPLADGLTGAGDDGRPPPPPFAFVPLAVGLGEMLAVAFEVTLTLGPAKPPAAVDEGVALPAEEDAGDAEGDAVVATTVPLADAATLADALTLLLPPTAPAPGLALLVAVTVAVNEPLGATAAGVPLRVPLCVAVLVFVLLGVPVAVFVLLAVRLAVLELVAAGELLRVGVTEALMETVDEGEMLALAPIDSVADDVLLLEIVALGVAV